MLEKFKIKVDDLEICLIDNKMENTPVLFFVHGWGADKFNLKAVYGHLENGYRIISIDLPGFGESDVPGRTIGSIEYAGYVHKLILKLGITKIIYVGHSFGGKIGILMSVLYPETICKLVLIDSTGIRGRRYPSWYARVIAFKFLKFIYGRIFRNEAMTEKLKGRFGSEDYKNAGVMRNILVKNVSEDFTGYLTKIKCPVFLYWGGKDRDTPLWMAKKMNELICDSGLFIVNDGGHFPFLQDNRIINIIDNFARS